MKYDFLEEILYDGYYPLDADQKKVCTAETNTVVAAGAGSGKTETLATRFAYLLMTNPTLHVENILALTFTKKAAGEIYERVYKRLSEYIKYLSEAKYNGKYDKEVNLCKRALKEFGDAKIQTLDSYSKDVLKLAANIYGIKPDFTIDGKDDVANLALPFVLKHKNESCFQKFCSAGDIENFAKTYFTEPIQNYTSLATPNNYFSDNFVRQTKASLAAWERILGNDNEKNNLDGPGLEYIYKNVESIINRTNLPVFDSKKTPFIESKFGQNIQNMLQAAPQGPDGISFAKYSIHEDDLGKKETEEKITSLLEVLSHANSLGLPSRQQEAKEICAEIKSYTDNIKKDSKTTLSTIKSLADFFSLYSSIKRMCELLDTFLLEVNAKKRASGNLSFKDVSEMALKILTEQIDIRKGEKHIIKKIMIDEFQDNNAKNRDLLFLLAEKDGYEVTKEGKSDAEFYEELLNNLSTDKLFFVGDEKQSIYKFRGADVSVFNKLGDDLKKVNERNNIDKAVRLNMTNNYRSKEALLKSFNIMFGNKKPHINEDYIPSIFYTTEKFQAYDADYLNDATYMSHSVDTELSNDNVLAHLCLYYQDENTKSKADLKDFNKEKVLGIKDTIFYFIARKIREIYDKEKEEGRNPSYSDFAILDKGRTNRSILVKYLNMFDIPYSLDQQAKLFDEGIVNDIYNFMRLCVYPADTKAYAAFLASPFAGLSIQSVENILAAEISKEKEHSRFTPFCWENDVPDDYELSEGDKTKLKKAKEFYEENKKRVLSEPLTKTIEYLWYNTGYFYETLLDINTNLYSEQFDTIYEIARTAEQSGNNASWFVDKLDSAKSNEGSFLNDTDEDLNVKDISYPVEKSDSIQILTVHQSKGLEFEHVFVTGFYQDPSKDKVNEVSFSDEYGVTLSKDNYFAKRNAKESKDKNLAEKRRLLYVAITRAKKDVFIVDEIEPIKTTKRLMQVFPMYYYGEKVIKENELDFDETKGKYNWTYCEKAIYEDGSPFDFIKILPVPFYATESTNTNQSLLRKNKITAAQDFFTRDETTIENKKNYPGKYYDENVKPSSFKKVLEYDKISFNINDFVPCSEYENLKTIMKGTDENKSEEIKAKDTDNDSASDGTFSYKEFGTMVHAYLEQACNTGKTNTLDMELLGSSVAKKFELSLSNDAKDIIRNACTQMTNRFLESELGKAFTEAKRSERLWAAEKGFKMNVKDVFMSGSIDLLFQTEDGKFIIVDYKTDGKVEPQIHTDQLATYRLATSILYGVKIEDIKTYIYYLRHNKEFDLTPWTGGNIDNLHQRAKMLIEQTSV